MNRFSSIAVMMMMFTACGMLLLLQEHAVVVVVEAFVIPPLLQHSHSLLRLHAATTTTQKMDMPWTKITKDDDDNKPLYYNQHRDWGAVYTSVDREQACRTFDMIDLDDDTNNDGVVGEIPKDLLGGTFYKVGGANFERNGQRYEHTLDGDGFVTAMTFFINNNKSNNNNKISVRYTGRFVETEYFEQEEEQDQILYRNVFGTQRPGGPWRNAFDIRLKNVANTNIMYWNDRLFALWEAGRPYELDPVTLQVLPITTVACQKGAASAADPAQIFEQPFCALDQDCIARGVTIDSGGPLDEKLGLGRFFTAHPHKVVNPETGEDNLVVFRSATNPIKKTCEMEFIEYDKDWCPITQRRQVYSINTAGGAPHDFAIASEYYCFFQNQLVLENLPYILGFKTPTQVMQLLVQQKAILHLAPRRQTGNSNHSAASSSSTSAKTKASPIDTLKFEVAQYFCIHTVPMVKVHQEVQGDDENGNQKTKRQLVIYSNGWDLTDEKYFPQHIESLPFLGNWAGPYPDFEKFVPPAHFYRTTIILDDDDNNNNDNNNDNVNVNEEPVVVRHEQVIPGLVMEFPVQDERDWDIIYMCVSSTESDSLPGVGLGKVNVATDTAEYWWAEPNIFVGEAVPVPKKDENAAGSWVLAFLYDTKVMKTTLAILDSERFEEGPSCRIQLPHFVPWGLHSTFVYR